MGWWKRRKASRLNDLGIRTEERGMHDEAETLYRKAAELVPEWDDPWFNLGLLFKRQRQWADSRTCNLEAVRRNPKCAPAYWNLGIASTALGDWENARLAWKGYGVKVPDGSGPLQMQLGLVPIRVNPIARPEVLWCDRIDPARAIIRSVPTPECERRWGDLVLHDGEPKGKRLLNGKEVSVFDEILVIEPSRCGTFRAGVLAPAEVDSHDLVERLEKAGLAGEDWTQSVVMLCKECSEGRPHEHHHGQRQEPPWSAERSFGVAAETESAIQAILIEWSGGGPGRSVLGLEKLL